MLKVRNKIISVLALVMAVMIIAFFGVNYSSNTSVKASDESEQTGIFRMYETASVRTKGAIAIRFGAQISKDVWQDNNVDGVLKVYIEIDKANNPDENEQVTKELEVKEIEFKDSNVTSVFAYVTFDNVADRLAEATAMQLESVCYYKNDEQPVYADGCAENDGVIQDMRAVAHWNVLNDTCDSLDAYYGTQTATEKDVVNYAVGTAENVTVTLPAGWDATDYSVYVNTTKIEATIADKVVTIAKSVIADLAIEGKDNYVQIFDSANNVVYQKLSNEIAKVDATYFSAVDGEIDADAIFGAGAVIVKAETLANDAVAEGTAFATLSVEEGKVLGLETKRAEFTTATIRLSTETDTKDVTFAKAATKIIDSAEDFIESFEQNADYIAVGVRDGYYALVTDIVLENALAHASGLTYTGTSDTLVNNKGTKQEVQTAGFVGVFDGQGHKITAPITEKGLFGLIVGRTFDADGDNVVDTSDGSQISEDTSFINLYLDLTTTVDNGAILYTNVENGSAAKRTIFSNIYVKLSGTNSVKGTFGGDSPGYTTSHVNMVFDTTNLDASGYIFGWVSRGMYTAGYSSNYDNVTVISDLTLARVRGSATSLKGPWGYAYASNVYDSVERPAFNTWDSTGGLTTDYYKYPAPYKAAYTPSTTTYQYSTVADYLADTTKAPTFNEQLWANAWTGVPTIVSDGYTLSVGNLSAGNAKIALNASETVALKDASGNDVDFTLTSSSEAIVSVNGAQITANLNGIATVTVSYEIDGYKHSKDILVISGTGIEMTEVEYNTSSTPILFSVADGELPSALINGETIEAAELIDGTALTVENNKITAGIVLDKNTTDATYPFDAATAKTIVVYTATRKITVYVTAYTKVIDSAEDMLYFNLDEEKVLSGSFVLANDIVITPTIANQITHSAIASTPSGTLSSAAVRGIFDGQGYTISGTAPVKGLFGAITRRTIIQNVEINVTAQDGGVIISMAENIRAHSKFTTQLLNSYIKVKGTVDKFYGIYGATANVDVISTIIDLSELTINKGGVGVAFSYYNYNKYYRNVGNNTSNYHNSLIITNLPYAFYRGNSASLIVLGNYDVTGLVEDTTTTESYVKIYKSEDGSVTYRKLTAAANAKTYASAEALQADHLTTDSYQYTYGKNVKEQFDSSYWSMEGDTTNGYIPVWVGNANA